MDMIARAMAASLVDNSGKIMVDKLPVRGAETGSAQITGNAIAAGFNAKAGSKGFRYLKHETRTGHSFLPISELKKAYHYYYTCSCPACADKKFAEKTLPANVYNANLITDINRGSMRLNADNLLYRHIPTGGAEITTIISAEFAPVGMAMFMKYRLNNG
jgi:hypothetical protein